MGYVAALTAAGCNVLEFETTGSYQGEWYALVEYEYEDEVGLIEGSYGSCSACDAFEAEFGYWDNEKDNYQERLVNFGKTYLPVMPIDIRICDLEKRVAKNDWGDYKEALEILVKWKSDYKL